MARSQPGARESRAGGRDPRDPRPGFFRAPRTRDWIRTPVTRLPSFVASGAMTSCPSARLTNVTKGPVTSPSETWSSRTGPATPASGGSPIRGPQAADSSKSNRKNLMAAEVADRIAPPGDQLVG